MKTFRLAILAGIAALTCYGDMFELLPAPAITGAPGSTIGWGYSITDTSTNWLQPLGLSATAFGNLNPTAIFDFPAVAPGQTVTETYSTSTLNGPCSSLPCGFYQVAIPNGTAPETVSGTFTISSDYYNGDPNNGGSDVGPAANLTSDFAVAVTPSTVPESSSIALLLTVLGFMFAGRTIAVRRKSNNCE